MNIFNYTIKIFNWLITVALGILGFLWLSQIMEATQISEPILNIFYSGSWMRFIFLTLSIYLVFFNILYLLGPLFNPKYVSHIELGVPGGNFAISVSAIEHSLKRAVKKLPEVHDVTIHLYKATKSETKPIRIVVHCSTWEGANVKEVTEKVKEIITLRFKEIIEVKEPPIFQIMIANIEERAKKGENKKKTQTADRQHMFYGPEYPIDSDL